ncbi:6384_t:CDS:2 [Funneliformis caledonium]|uniref:6384_t:CDS:1 n=1 Tax=Funneliformis caledonium TaxID=1117310 RepID=A0A9N8ZCH6_9GLOM|nr:6384_t:CDS:2 [Funneliformis caledonium]
MSSNIKSNSTDLSEKYVNVSCLKVNNSDFAIFINTIVNKHNYYLNVEVVAFKKEKRFTNEIIDDIQFLT